MQDEFVDLCSHRIFEDIGDLRGCKSLASNRWRVFELGSNPVQDKLSILVRECNLVEKKMKTGQNII